MFITILHTLISPLSDTVLFLIVSPLQTHYIITNLTLHENRYLAPLAFIPLFPGKLGKALFTSDGAVLTELPLS